jgi:hypothetical protein
MSEPSGQMSAAAGSGDLRASHADREQVIGTLKAAFVQGRLARDEFGLRVGQALASRTCAELAAVTADLPAGLTAAQPSKPARARGERPIVRRPGLVMTVATVLYAGMWPLAFVLPRNGEGDPVAGVSLAATATLAYFLVLITTGVWAQAPGSRGDKRPVGSCRDGQHLAWAVRHPGTCRQPIWAGNSRRSIPMIGTLPRQYGGVFGARRCRFTVTAPVAPSRRDRAAVDCCPGPAP